MLLMHQAIFLYTTYDHPPLSELPCCCLICSEGLPLSLAGAMVMTHAKMPSQQALVRVVHLAAATCAPDPKCSTGQHARS